MLPAAGQRHGVVDVVVRAIHRISISRKVARWWWSSVGICIYVPATGCIWYETTQMTEVRSYPFTYSTPPPRVEVSLGLSSAPISTAEYAAKSVIGVAKSCCQSCEGEKRQSVPLTHLRAYPKLLSACGSISSAQIPYFGIAVGNR